MVNEWQLKLCIFSSQSVAWQGQLVFYSSESVQRQECSAHLYNSLLGGLWTGMNCVHQESTSVNTLQLHESSVGGRNSQRICDSIDYKSCFMTHHAHQVLRFHRRIVSNSLKFYVRQIVYPQSCKKSQSTVQRQDGFIPLASMCIKWPGCLSKNPPAFGAWFHPWKHVATSTKLSGENEKQKSSTGWLLHQTKLYK